MLSRKQVHITRPYSKEIEVVHADNNSRLPFLLVPLALFRLLLFWGGYEWSASKLTMLCCTHTLSDGKDNYKNALHAAV